MGTEKKPLSPGDRFGMLTVIGKDEVRTRERKKQYYFCQCDCGSPIKSVLKASLVSKTKPTYSCGCHTKYAIGFIDNREVALARLLYGKMKTRHTKKIGDAEDNLIPFEEFFDMINKPCYYCGRVKSSFITDRRDKNIVLHYNGLDRMDSNIGYRRANVVSCCAQCNIAKGELSIAEFRNYLTRIHDFQIDKRKANGQKSD